MTEKKKIGIFGQTGSGKSTIAGMITQDLKRLFVYDTLGNSEYPGVVIETYAELLNFWEKTHKGSFRIKFRPVNPYEDFDAVCELVYHLGECTYLVEETDSFLGSQTSSLPDYFLHLVQRGRHKNVEMLCITQRPFAIPPILRSQMKEMYVFKQFEKADVDFFRPVLREHTDEIVKLEKYEYLHWDGENVTKGFTVKN